MMKRTFLMMLALLLSATAAFAGPKTRGQTWTSGWDNFSEPLNYKTSYVSWSVNSTNSKLTVTFALEGATPSKLYQVGLNFFCTTFPATFGQFPNEVIGGGVCPLYTAQGVTLGYAAIEVGVVTTDIYGNGSFTIVIGPIAPGTYDLEFFARDGAGCDLIGGAGNGACTIDFQSPGPIYGDAITITIP
ncbi:MAG: hypothetical protein ACLQLC_10865 [Candidatus Sulfotelmatobacter sp.]